MISLITSSTTDPILSSAACRTVNVMNIFNSAPRRRYGDRLYTSPINHAEAVGYASHSHETISLPHSLYNSCLENHLTVRIQKNTNLQQTA
jgi:hypothetical protein